MKESRFTGEQIVFALKQAKSSMPVEEDWCKPADVLQLKEEVWQPWCHRASETEVFGCLFEHGQTDPFRMSCQKSSEVCSSQKGSGTREGMLPNR